MPPLKEKSATQPRTRLTVSQIHQAKVSTPPRQVPEEPPVPEITDSGTSDAEFNQEFQRLSEEAGIASIPSSQPGLIDTPERGEKEGLDRTKSGPPTVDEWQGFLGRIVVRALVEGYLALMLKDIELTDHERAKIALSRQDLKEIAAPFATVIAKQDWARKHGREIIGLADSYEAGIRLLIWMRRVQRIRNVHIEEIKAKPKPSRNPIFASHSHARRNVGVQEQQLAEKAADARVFAAAPPPQNQMPAPAQTIAEQAGAPIAPVITMPSINERVAETVRQAVNGSGDTSGIRKPTPPDPGRLGSFGTA